MNWDTLGMRGTCSSGFALKANGEIDQVLPHPYEKIQSHTMMPVAHLTWAAVWSGLAAAAVERARRSIARSSQSAVEQPPPGVGSSHAGNYVASRVEGNVSLGTSEIRDGWETRRPLESLEFQTAMNLLKVNASEMATSTVMSAMQACGLSGYRNDGEFSVSRHLRDVLSSSIMINNERILANAATASLLIETPHSLWG